MMGVMDPSKKVEGRMKGEAVVYYKYVVFSLPQL